MLYILPPPSVKPPSVWDLIINFHRKGCQESTCSSSPPNKSLKFDCRETKSQRTWCKTSPSHRSHVSGAITLMTSKNTIGFTFSLWENQTRWTHEIFFRLFHFLPKSRLDFSKVSLFSRDNNASGKWKSFELCCCETLRKAGDLKIVFRVFSFSKRSEMAHRVKNRRFVADFPSDSNWNFRKTRKRFSPSAPCLSSTSIEALSSSNLFVKR